MDARKENYGVESICRQVPITPSSYYAAKTRPPSAQSLRDEELAVARCTVERLMPREGLYGAVRGKRMFTTIADPQAPRPADLVCRHFSGSAPNRLGLGDFIHVRTWAGFSGASRLGRGSSSGLKRQSCQRVSIGERSILGAGAVVTKDVPDGAVAACPPATIVFSVEDFAERVVVTSVYIDSTFPAAKRGSLVAALMPSEEPRSHRGRD